MDELLTLDRDGAVAVLTWRAEDNRINDASMAAFHARLFACLMRYKSLGGAGFQAAVGPGVGDALAAALGPAVEGFASALNARTPRFGTAFSDVDAPFGGCGSFFE